MKTKKFITIQLISALIIGITLHWTLNITNAQQLENEIPTIEIGKFSNATLYEYNNGLDKCYILQKTEDDYTTIPNISCFRIGL